jgi:T-complex protein 1 subunit delta
MTRFAHQDPNHAHFLLAISDAVRTSLGPRGMDKMVSLNNHLRCVPLIDPPNAQIQTSKGEVIITNDGATILKSIQALHPAAKMACSFILLCPSKE